MFGFLNIDKPLGATSHDVVAAVRRAARQQTGQKVKVGHAGTLDPLATGVLIVCVGAATRLSEYVMASAKTYRAQLRFGETTATYDAEGEVIQRRDAAHLTAADLHAVLPRFTGQIAQLPPMYSAVKQGGRKLYELARAGETVERQPRQVRIDTITLAHFIPADADRPPQAELIVECGPGTYIRSLAHDIGETLGIGAHLSGLVRTRSGGFALEDAVPLAALSAPSDWTPYLVPPVQALSDWPRVMLNAEEALALRQGKAITAAPDAAPDALGLDTAGHLVAVLRLGTHGDKWHPHKVFS